MGVRLRLAPRLAGGSDILRNDPEEREFSLTSATVLRATSGPSATGSQHWDSSRRHRIHDRCRQCRDRAVVTRRQAQATSGDARMNRAQERGAELRRELALRGRVDAEAVAVSLGLEVRLWPLEVSLEEGRSLRTSRARWW